MTQPLPYSGLRVLDISQGLAGPYCAGLLGAQGAQVTKIEPPGGDWIRNAGGGKEGMTSLAIMGSAGKRSACIDATKPEGRALILKMARQSDVFVQNFRPGVIERLGFGYDVLSKDNPKLVYVSITGFGASGPDAKKPATDSVLQAFTGMARINRDADGTPRRIPFLVPDTVTGVYAAQAVGAALFARERTGRGRHVQVSLMDSCAALQTAPILDAALSDGTPPLPPTIPAGIFRTSDGYITVTSMNETMFASILKVLDLGDLGRDPRVAQPAERQKNAALVNLEVSRRLANHSTSHWMRVFTEADVLCAEAQDYAGFRAAPQPVHMQTFRDVDQPPYGALPMPRMPGSQPDWPMGPAPRAGEHTFEILAEAGVTEAERAALVASGVIRQST
ncbi:MAG: CoA transferase [Proteobacteria bacterium]|nr:CoA transferase [Pseudomonadota bacterium]